MYFVIKTFMSLSYERTFRVRYYECDAYGHVNNTHYLRYVQETALDAAMMMGYDESQAAVMNRHWQLREVDIAYVRPLKYGDTVLVKTHIEAYDASRVRHRYTFQIANTSDEVARARTEVELRDNVTHHPAPIPAHWSTVFAADSAWQPEPFPPESAPPQRIFTLQRRVRWQDVDASHQLHPATLLDYIAECGNEVLIAHGWPIARMMQAGFGIIMRRMRVEFMQPIRLDDELTISTWASEFKRISAVRYYLFTHASDNTLVARAHVLGVWLNTTTMQPIRLPPHFLADFATNVVI